MVLMFFVWFYFVILYLVLCLNFESNGLPRAISVFNIRIWDIVDRTGSRINESVVVNATWLLRNQICALSEREATIASYRAFSRDNHQLQLHFHLFEYVGVVKRIFLCPYDSTFHVLSLFHLQEGEYHGYRIPQALNSARIFPCSSFVHRLLLVCLFSTWDATFIFLAVLFG